jgi:hypothetical protein
VQHVPFGRGGGGAKLGGGGLLRQRHA